MNANLLQGFTPIADFRAIFHIIFHAIFLAPKGRNSRFSE